MVDTIILQKTRNVREYCSFYTESEPILEYMVSKLGSLDGETIFEPCAGDGAFIEKILEKNPSKHLDIVAYDLNALAIKNLEVKFKKDQRIRLKHSDTLLDSELDEQLRAGKRYSRIIGNPPYGAWQDQEKRSLLKAKYGGYVRETYSLFMRRCLNLLQNDGRMVFIVPDTFLALHMHEEMRRNILTQFTIEELLLMPSNFFPGVNFGYANLCVITIVARPPIDTSTTRIVKVNSDVEVLRALASGDYSLAESDIFTSQESIVRNVGSSFLISSDLDVTELINKSTLTLGNIADCVTGFYSGSNSENIFPISNLEASGEGSIDLIDVEMHPGNQADILLGCNTKRYIPIYMGGKAVINKQIEKCVNWSTEDIVRFKSDGRARFQNSSYYFRKGIGVPMVKSKTLKAFRIDRQLFDQSVVGIFPHEERFLNFLLLYLNSDLCSRIINAINHTANNSANYVKKVPVPLSEDFIIKAEELVEKFDNDGDVQALLVATNRMFENVGDAFSSAGHFDWGRIPVSM